MAHASVLASRPLGGMVPDPALLTPAHATELVRADGRPQPGFREQLRKIPSWRNAWSVLSVWLQAALILGLDDQGAAPGSDLGAQARSRDSTADDDDIKIHLSPGYELESRAV